MLSYLDFRLLFTTDDSELGTGTAAFIAKLVQITHVWKGFRFYSRSTAGVDQVFSGSLKDSITYNSYMHDSYIYISDSYL